jgi:hypothetical protein
MQIEHNLNDERYQNVSLGMQLKPTTKVVDNPASLKADAFKLLRYTNIFGMFERFNN